MTKKGYVELEHEVEIQWRSVSVCPVCGNKLKHFYQQVEWGTLKINFWICRCGIVYADRVPLNEEDVGKYYEEFYTPLTEQYWGRDGLIENEVYRAKRIVYSTLSYPEVHRHLDIGCGYGMVMKEVQNKYGCVSEGCDIRSLADGFTVYPSLDEVKGKYDLVTCIHTLEHTIDPVGYLRAMRDVCSKYLFMEVPSLSPLVGVLSSHHLFGFTCHTLHDIVARAGFKVKEVGQAAHTPPKSEPGSNKIELQIFAEVEDE